MRSPESIFSAPAAADYSATLYRFVTIDTSGNMATSGAGGEAIGVMSNAPASGAQGRCEWDGTHRIEVGTGGLTLGAKVYSDANGKGVTGVATAGAPWFGICTVAGLAGEVAQFVWKAGYNAG